MVERHIIEPGKRITYDGVFDAVGLYDVIKDWAGEKGYFPVEKAHAESVKPEGKFIELKLDPVFKKYSDYVRGVFNIHIQMSEVKDVVLVQDGRKVKLKEGKVLMNIQSYLESDYEKRWVVKPMLYVVRTLFEKYVLSPFMSRFERTLREDQAQLEAYVKSYLNLSKFRK